MIESPEEEPQRLDAPRVVGHARGVLQEDADAEDEDREAVPRERRALEERPDADRRRQEGEEVRARGDRVRDPEAGYVLARVQGVSESPREVVESTRSA